MASIASDAFYDCTDITNVTSLNRKPYTINSYTFSASVYKDATLYVPMGTKGKYELTSAWNKFETIEEIEVSVRPRGDVNGDYAVDVADIATIINIMAANARLQQLR